MDEVADDVADGSGAGTKDGVSDGGAVLAGCGFGVETYASLGGPRVEPSSGLPTAHAGCATLHLRNTRLSQSACPTYYDNPARLCTQNTKSNTS